MVKHVFRSLPRKIQQRPSGLLRAAAFSRCVDCPHRYSSVMSRFVSPKPVAPSKTTYRHGEGEHILFIDDEIVITQLMIKILNRLSYRVTAFNDPELALLAFRKEPAAYQAVITDLSMPHMSGFDLARAIRKTRPDIPILMSSGYMKAEDELAAKALGIEEILLKPDSIDRLSAALQRAIRKAQARATCVEINDPDESQHAETQPQERDS